MKELWEILVPYSDNNGTPIPIKEHRIWDAQIRQISGGLTIMGMAKGQWVSPNGKLFIEKMIPVRVMCTREQIEQIVKLTVCFYKQEAVLAYKISDEMILHFKEIIEQADGFK